MEISAGLPAETLVLELKNTHGTRSILLRLSMEGDNQFDEWFTYLVLLLFVGTASFWVCAGFIVKQFYFCA
jgi:hypothetical protein